MSEKAKDHTPSDPKGPSNLYLMRRVLTIGWEFWRDYLNVLILQVLLLVVSLASLALQGKGLDYLHWVLRSDADVNVKQPHWILGLTPPPEWSPIQVLIFIAALMLLSTGLLGLLRYKFTIVQARTVQNIIVSIRSRVYDKLQRLSFRFFEANETGSIINRVGGDVQSVRMFLDVALVQVIVLILSLGLFLGYMIRINPLLTIACLGTTPILLVISNLFLRYVRPLYETNRDLSDKMILTVSESVQGIHVIKGFAREKQEIEKFRKANLEVKNQQGKIFLAIATYSPSVESLTYINIVVLLIYGGYLVIHGQLALGGGLWVFLSLLQRVSNQVATIANMANQVQQSLVGARRVFEILDAPLEIQSKPNAIKIPLAKGRVTFDHVSFAYKDDMVLKDLHFTVEPGQCVAILGATGSGKSTLLSLIPRFYEPTQGRLLLDDVDIRDLDLDDLRLNIGLVFQESFLFSNTVANNIAFGHPNATRAQIEQAAKLACAHDFILELKNGYDTVLGERGSDLSGGQRQRLSIARALLLEPPVLILDDALSAVDPQTEHEMLQAIDNAAKNRTTFLVAHRLSTLRRADRVIVLDKGRIVQMGTHEELMAKRGHYQEAALLQIADAESRMLLNMSNLTTPLSAPDTGATGGA